jgi:hypothetical protein
MTNQGVFQITIAIFTGAEKRESIKLWDVRARSAVYELATGNNAVVGMVWDSTRSALYAATECNYMDRLGRHHDYRRAKILTATKLGEMTRSSTQEDGDDDDYDTDDDDDDRAWPMKAFHAENYFGYTFDAGDHGICGFNLKFR